MSSRSPKVRAGNLWTEAKFWGFIRSNLRRAWMKWPARSAALKAAQVKYTGKDKRRKWSYRCASCQKLFKGCYVQVDHIEECGSLKSYEDLPGFVRRLFCEIDGYQILCKKCHKTKTHGG